LVGGPDVIAGCLRRIAEQEADVRAWVEVAPRAALESSASDGPLAGIPFGAKDIFETRGMATEYGSPLYAGRKGESDAALIQHLRGEGAVLLGKTQTTAFASFDPAPTRNPRAPGHTPGGSSAGSAAAVAAGMVPVALGTQTLASVLRPASYCGVCGFKPSFGLIPIDGVLPFAPSLDTVGFFTATVADMQFLWSRGFGGSSDVSLRDLARLRVPAEDPMARAMEDAAQRLRAAGIRVDDLDPPAGWDALIEAAFAINAYEGARTHERRYRDFGDRLGARLAALVRRGLAMPAAEYQAARERVDRMRTDISRIFWEYPAILTPAATGPPPAGFDFTGDPSAGAPWSALGLPAISVPLAGYNLPMGLQLSGAWGRDDAVVVVAAEAERLLAGEARG
jgi:Asp-tRNA(Asn)/Glu-tRNA(Gln) amidotransferase A subunit family amidase